MATCFNRIQRSCGFRIRRHTHRWDLGGFDLRGDPLYTAITGPVTIVLFDHRQSQSVDWLIRLVSDWASMRIRDQFSKFPIGSSLLMSVSPEGLTAPENLPLFLSNQPASGDREDCHKTLAVCHHFDGTYGTSRRIFRRFGRGPTDAD